nr:immunoglobulin heavy chain junction region [Macaca mulatta]
CTTNLVTYGPYGLDSW